MRGHLGGRWGRVAPLVGVLSLLSAAGVASAASSSTTVMVDCGRGSDRGGDLQAAIDNPEVATIVIRGRCAGQLVIIGRPALTLQGEFGAVLDGQGAGPALFIRSLPEGGINTGPVVLDGLRVTSGRPGIHVVARSLYSLTVRNTIVSGNEQAPNGSAAGIDVDAGTLNLLSSSVSQNGAGSQGSGISTSDAVLNVRDSIISQNTGGGIVAFDTFPATIERTAITHNHSGGIATINTPEPLRLIDSIVSGNTATAGAGIYGDNVSLTRSTVVRNSATGDGGGIYSAGTLFGAPNLSVVDSVVASNTAGGRGGGVFNTGGPFGAALIQNSTIHGNRAGSGGGIYNDQGANLSLQTGTAIIKNTASNTGGGIFNNQGTVSIAPGVPIVLNKPNNCTGLVC